MNQQWATVDMGGYKYQKDQEIEPGRRSHSLLFQQRDYPADKEGRTLNAHGQCLKVVDRLRRRKLEQSDIPVSLARMVERLANIREVGILFNEGEVQSPRVRTVLSDIDPEQMKMFAALELARFRTE